jgi:hypothetical protein
MMGKRDREGSPFLPPCELPAMVEEGEARCPSHPSGLTQREGSFYP